MTVLGSNEHACVHNNIFIHIYELAIVFYEEYGYVEDLDTMYYEFENTLSDDLITSLNNIINKCSHCQDIITDNLFLTTITWIFKSIHLEKI